MFFQASDGLTFERLPSGAIRINAPSGLRVDQTIDPETWVRLIAQMSHRAGEPDAIPRAKAFHRARNVRNRPTPARVTEDGPSAELVTDVQVPGVGGEG